MHPKEPCKQLITATELPCRINQLQLWAHSDIPVVFHHRWCLLSKDLTSLESSCWLITASASSAAWRLASATVRSILALSEVIMSWAFRSASDTAFCNSAIAWRFTSLTASSAEEERNPHQHRTFGTGLHRTGVWNAADTLLYWQSLF